VVGGGPHLEFFVLWALIVHGRELKSDSGLISNTTPEVQPPAGRHLTATR
jgi:hypothetical protein